MVDVLMGEKYQVAAACTYKYAERIPLSAELAAQLGFCLEVRNTEVASIEMSIVL
jgi:hypothetical protein